MGYLLFRQSVSHVQQVTSHGAKGLGFLTLGSNEASYHSLFVDIQTGTALVNDLHGNTSQWC
jgi:hypothetical protein